MAMREGKEKQDGGSKHTGTYAQRATLNEMKS